MKLNMFIYAGDDTFLVHSGIKGQHWGERNGPPYPLDKKTHASVVSSAKKAVSKAVETHKTKKKEKEDAAEEKRAEKAKKQLQKDMADPSKMWKNRDMYTTKELKEAVERMKAENDLYNMKVTQLKRPKEVADTVAGYLQTANNLYTNANNLYKNANELKKYGLGGPKKTDAEKAVEERAKLAADIKNKNKILDNRDLLDTVPDWVNEYDKRQSASTANNTGTQTPTTPNSERIKNAASKTINVTSGAARKVYKKFSKKGKHESK